MDPHIVRYCAIQGYQAILGHIFAHMDRLGVGTTNAHNFFDENKPGEECYHPDIHLQGQPTLAAPPRRMSNHSSQHLSNPELVKAMP